MKTRAVLLIARASMSRSSPHHRLTRVTRITSVYTTETSVSEFLEKFPVLKADANRSFFRVEPCSSAETICCSQSPFESPFFYMYACLFLDLHVSLPFDDFTVGILKILNMAPTQLHPNTWTSIQAFRLTCDILRYHPTPSCFLIYYTSHPSERVLWHSLISRSGNVIFSPFSASYKRFKERFLKVFLCPATMPYFFYASSRSMLLNQVVFMF